VTPYYSDDSVTIYHGEALAVLATLPDASVDHIVTDPPYSSGGMMRGDRTMKGLDKYTGANGIQPDLEEFTGDNRDQRGHAYWCALWLDQCRRVAKPGAILAMFTDWRQLPTATDALQSGGWVWRGVSVWGKTSSRPIPDRFAASCEFLVWGTNGPRSIADGKNANYAAGLFMYAPPTERVHMTQKPVEVLRWALSFAKPGDVVLDPFVGSGTTLEAAKDLGCKSIGIELNEMWCAYARARTAQEVLDFGGAK